MLRSFLRGLARFLFKILARITVEGMENIPEKGGAILASNHLSRLDSPFALAVIERSDVTGLVADTYRRNVLLRPLIEGVHGIWLNRGEADLHALRAAREHLQHGGLLGIAPEGTRSTTGALMRAKTGVAFLADKVNVPIVPFAITGTEDAIERLLHLHRPRLTMRFGKPFQLLPLERNDRSASLQRNTDEIMCQIAALLPPHYRGYYAGHPRLQELLGES